MNVPEELQRLSDFHGHLGPYVVVGYLMGKVARREFPEKIWGFVYSGVEPPISCIIDGIQFSSCCTLGKNNISVYNEDRAMARFHDQQGILEIRLRNEVREEIENTMGTGEEESLALKLFHMKDPELFEIIEGGSKLRERLIKL